MFLENCQEKLSTVESSKGFMCSRSVSKGDRTWFTCHAHFWLAGIRDGKISRDDLGVARPFGRSSSSFDEDFFFFFFKGARGGEGNKRG